MFFSHTNPYISNVTQQRRCFTDAHISSLRYLWGHRKRPRTVCCTFGCVTLVYIFVLLVDILPVLTYYHHCGSPLASEFNQILIAVIHGVLTELVYFNFFLFCCSFLFYALPEEL